MCEKIRYGYIFYIATVNLQCKQTFLHSMIIIFFQSLHFIAVDETAMFQCKDTPRKRMQRFLNFVHSTPNTQEWEQGTTVCNVFERELTSWRRCSIGNSLLARLRFQGAWRKRLLWVHVFLLKGWHKA